MMRYVHASSAEKFIPTLPRGKVRLICCDPPYCSISKSKWDRQWANDDAYAEWLSGIFLSARDALTPDGSLIFFGAIGMHGHRPLFKVMDRLERPGCDGRNPYTYRNMIAWKKRRGYGKSHDYIFAREEICWYSASDVRTEVVFNIPLLEEKRGYAGFNSKYPAKSEFKRVSNVWADIPELQRPKRDAQKPLPLMRRVISTHSNPGDLVVDMFAGWGTTGEAALGLGRDFVGCEIDEQDANDANERCVQARAEYDLAATAV